MFNGYVMVFFEIESTPIVACSFPACLYFFERWIKTKSFLSSLFFVLAIAISISSGYTHLIIFQFLFIAAYMINKFLTISKSNNDPKMFDKTTVIHATVVIILTGFLAANFITSHLLFLDDPQRSSIPFNSLYRQTGQLPAKYLTTLIFPDFFGSPVEDICFTPRIKNAQPYNNYSELCIYPGIVTLFLVIACLPYFFRHRDIKFFLLTALVTITISMGSPLYYPFSRVIPGLGFSSPTRILYIFLFSFSNLAAIGANLLLSDRLRKKPAIFSLWMALSLIIVFLALFVQSDDGKLWAANSIYWLEPQQILHAVERHFDILSKTILTPLSLSFITVVVLSMILFTGKSRSKSCFLFLALTILSYDLIQFGLRYNTASPKQLEYPETEGIRFLQKDTSLFRIMSFGRFLHNSFAAFDIADIGGYHSFYPKRYGEYLHLSQNGKTDAVPNQFSRWIQFKSVGSPLLDIINTKYILCPPATVVKSPKLERVYDSEIVIYKNKDAFPRFFFVHDFEYATSRMRALEKLSTYSLSDFRAKVILETLPSGSFTNPNGVPNIEHNTNITLISYEPNRIEISVSSNQRGFLVLSDSYHRDWKAFVDETQSEILRANYIMRAVPVKAGTHRVVFVFQPKLLITGITITTVGWALLVFLLGTILLQGRIRRRSTKRSACQSTKPSSHHLEHTNPVIFE
jgi:hypothetical protein